MARPLAVELSIRTFLDRFREVVERYRERPAVIHESTTITYGQLDRRSNALAHALVRVGLQPDTIVALLIDRTPDLLVALLGIVKAGAAYVALDPGLPTERLAYMIDDAQPALVVTNAGLGVRVPAGMRWIDVADPTGGVEIDEPPVIARRPEHRAYVLYTSGSTGTPKAVEITHAAVANLIDAFMDEPGLASHDRVLAHSAISFDISIIELWLPLVAGAAIVLARAPDDRDPRALAELIARHEITFVSGTPSFFRMLLDAGWRDGHGKTVFCGGEPMSRALVDALLDTGAAVWNIYGPTETTVWTAAWRARRDGPIAVGRPIRNTHVHILDSALNPVRSGEAGELCISGAGLARGYLNRPALTAERFVAHPLAGLDGRLYRSGDLARLRDGDIEILGRLDRQIKLDGFRIEPGEIESVLSAHPRVRHAIVRAVEHSPGDVRLVAYAVHGSMPPPAVDELLELSKRRLPAHMIPSAFVMLEAAPLTPHGKVDHGALPTVDWRRGAVPTSDAPPRTPTERRLRDLWCDVLGLETVGIDDNFFDVGGRSRLGASLFAKIEREFGIRLPLATLFEAPTIATLAGALDRAATRSAISWDTVVGIRTSGSQSPLFFVHPVGGNVLVYRELISHIDPDVPCFGLQAIGLDGVRTPLTSVEQMAERYVQDLRRHQARGPYRLCAYSFGGMVAFAMAAGLRGAGETVSLLALIDAPFPDRAPTGGDAMRQRAARTRLHPMLARARRHASSLRRLGIGGYVHAVTTHRRGEASNSAREPVRAANLRAAADYVPPSYDGPMLYFKAAMDAPVDDRRECWRAIAPGTTIIEIAGRHADLRDDPMVQIIAREINSRLDCRP